MSSGTWAEYQLDAGSTKDTPYLTLTGELWCVVFEILDKINRVITAHHSIWYETYHASIKNTSLTTDVVVTMSTLSLEAAGFDVMTTLWFHCWWHHDNEWWQLSCTLLAPSHHHRPPCWIDRAYAYVDGLVQERRNSSGGSYTSLLHLTIDTDIKYIRTAHYIAIRNTDTWCHGIREIGGPVDLSFSWVPLVFSHWWRSGADSV